MRILLIILLLVIGGQKLLYEHEIDFDFFKTDNLNNLYVVSGETILLLDNMGTQIFEYNNPKLGNINSIDQTSSLRTMVFYKDQSTFLVLDNTLTVQSPRVILSQFGFNYITLMCASENNHYWCYDAENNSVVRINQQINIVSNGVDLNQLLSIVVDPSEIIERHGKVFLNDPKNGIHLFDTYGNYEKTLNITNVKYIEVKNNILYYSIDNKVNMLDYEIMLGSTILESDELISGFNIQANKIFYKVGNKIFEKKYQ